MHKLADIVIVKLKMCLREQMLYISQIPCDEIVHPYYVVTFFQESLAQMTSQEAGSACN